MTQAAPRRIGLVLEYDGTAYRGFQAQRGKPTVQGELERVLAQTLGTHVKTAGAGRTDAGAHAWGQVAAFTTTAGLPTAAVPRALNHRLPPDIRVAGAAETLADFDPRRHARLRRYRYLALCQPEPSALWGRFTHHLRTPLDTEAMARAAQAFVGVRDYGAFTGARGRRRDTVREIFAVQVWRQGALVAVEFAGTAFLPQQVRRMAGALVRVGQGRVAEDEVAGLLARRTGRPGAPALPARGLHLAAVEYPPGVFDISGPEGQRTRGEGWPGVFGPGEGAAPWQRQ